MYVLRFSLLATSYYRSDVHPIELPGPEPGPTAMSLACDKEPGQIRTEACTYTQLPLCKSVTSISMSLRWVDMYQTKPTISIYHISQIVRYIPFKIFPIPRWMLETCQYLRICKYDRHVDSLLHNKCFMAV